MSEEHINEENQEQETQVEETQEDQEQPTNKESSSESDIERLVEERLAKMKGNMDRMVKERDDALKAKAEIEKARKEEQMERLKEEGKLQELAEMKAADLEAKLKVMEEENVRLKRDGVLNDALAALDFRNDRSRTMARQDIVGELIQNEEGQWVHKSGKTIQEYVEAYSKEEDNSFLFRVKSNSGGGSTSSQQPSDVSKQKSIGEMTTQEILAMAAKGQLGSMKY